LTHVIDLQRLWQSSTSRQGVGSKTVLKKIVSVIVVVTRIDVILAHTIQSVLAQEFIGEVILVNASGLASLSEALESVISAYPRCYVTPAQGRLSLAQAQNLGSRYASGQYLFFLNQNVVLPKHAVEQLLFMGMNKTLPWISAIQGEVQSGISVSKLTNQFKEIYFYSAHQNRAVTLQGGGIDACILNSPAFLIPTKAFIELKGFDKKYRHYFHHYDLGLRAMLAGGGIYQHATLQIQRMHFQPLSLSVLMKQTWQCFIEGIQFYRKYIGSQSNLFKKSVFYVRWMLSNISECAHQALTWFKQSKRRVKKVVSS